MQVEEVKDMLLHYLSSKLVDAFVVSDSNKHELVQVLYDLAWTEEQPYAWRAAYVLEHIVTADIELIRPYLDEIPKRLYETNADGLKRHFLKILLLFPVQEVDMGRLLDLAFRWLESPSESIAVRAHCMSAIEKVLKYEPDIKEEFMAMLSLFTNDESAGLRSRSRKILMRLQKEQ